MNGLKAELDSAKKEIETTYSVVDLKPQFQKVWNELNKVYNLYDMGWLKINPKNIRLTSIFVQNDSLNVFLGLSARPFLSNEKPLETTSPIPNLSDVNRRPGFNIFLDAVLNYDSLSVILNQQLQGKTFELDKGIINKKFIVKNCHIYGTGNEKLIIRVKFGGSNSGTVYLTGKPEYNRREEVIEFRDLDFDIKTKNSLLNTANWLFNKKIINEIKAYTRFQLTTYFIFAKMAATQQLNREWIKGIRSYGGMTNINLIGIYPLNKNLVIRSSSSGNLSIQAGDIDFSF